MKPPTKTFIRNRDNAKLCVVTEGQGSRLAFVMHGLGGTKDQPQIRTMITAFLDAGYRVISFDAAHTFGESEGEYEDATFTNYYADLEDVIAWAARQPRYSEPFVLCGHSLGGMSTALFAQQHPGKVAALAPLSTAVSGALTFQKYASPKGQAELQKWQADGIKTTLSHSGRPKSLKWSHMEDRLQYDLLPQASALTMPVLMIVGERDDITPLDHQQQLYDAIPGRKELHIIPGAEHTFREPQELEDLQQIMNRWLSHL